MKRFSDEEVQEILFMTINLLGELQFKRTTKDYGIYTIRRANNLLHKYLEKVNTNE